MYQSLTSIRRILCLHIPRFAAVISGAGEDQPRALIEQHRQMMIVHSINRNAQTLGVAPGMALSDARAFAKDLKTADLDPARIRTAKEQLAMWLGRYSPLIGYDPLVNPLMVSGGAGFWIDISGVAHLFGGEQRLMADLSAHLKRMNFCETNMAIAPTPGAAWAMAHHSTQNLSTIAKNGIRSALYPFPPTALRLTEKTLEALDRLGLRRIADIVRLPRTELGQRFPRDTDNLLLRLDQAFGDTAESIEPIAPPAPYACRRLYPEPVQHKNTIIAGLSDGLKRVLSALERDQRGARQVNLRLFKVNGHCAVIRVKTNAPTRNHQSLLRLFDERLNGLDVGFGLDTLVVEAPNHEALGYEQTSVLTKHGQSSNTTVFDSIANRLGEQAVRRFVVEASHTPGSDAVGLPLGADNANTAISWQRAYRDRVLVGRDQDAPVHEREQTAVRQSKLLPPIRSNQSLAKITGSRARPLHLFAKPQPVAFVRSHRHQARMTWRRLDHQLIDLQGPERITADWWKAHIAGDPIASAPRDYYQATDEQGRQFYLFETLTFDHEPTGVWHVAGFM